MTRILVIDDDAALTKAVSLRLRNAGFDVTVCSSSLEATHVVPGLAPHLIILDVDMARYPGHEFHQCLRFSDRARNIPVVYLSGHDTEANRRMAFELGAHAFLTKPYQHEEMVRTIRSVLQTSGAAGTSSD